MVFIAVGTPPREDGSADLRYVDEVAEAIGRNLNGYKVVVTKSTVPIGTGERIRGIVERHNAGGARFDVVSNPEFLREGSAIEDFMHPDRVVIGADSEQAVAIMRDLYAPLYLIETPIVITNVASSEMIKYASNAFLATKISFINEMAEICERVGADVHQVAKGMGLDKRINPKFLHPGPGYGGSCFPKDTSALVQIAGEHGYRLRIVEAVLEVNRERRAAMLAKMRRLLPDVRRPHDRRARAWPSSRTPTTCATRPPSTSCARRSAPARGCASSTRRRWRPRAPCSARQGVAWCADAYDAAAGADLLVLFTEWNQFRNLDLERLKGLLRRAAHRRLPQHLRPPAHARGRLRVPLRRQVAARGARDRSTSRRRSTT